MAVIRREPIPMVPECKAQAVCINGRHCLDAGRCLRAGEVEVVPAEQLRGAVEALDEMEADADRTRSAMSQHSGHGQMAAWAAFGERCADRLGGQ